MLMDCAGGADDNVAGSGPADAPAAEGDSERAVVFVASPLRLLRESLGIELAAALPEAVIIDAENPIVSQYRDRMAVYILDVCDRHFEGQERPAAIRAVHRRLPLVRVLVLSRSQGDAETAAWAQAGADGFVSTHQSFELLRIAVQLLLAGQLFFSPQILKSLSARRRTGDGDR